MKIGEASTEAYAGAATWAAADPTSPQRGDPLLLEIDPAHYEFEGVFARGGVGLILKAHDRRLRRPVAIKLLLRGDPAMQARFEREAGLTAQLQHPGVVPIYEAGRWPNGESFYAMRLVEGQPLSAVIAGCRTLDERLALLPKVVAVSEAVAYAHTERVIHRDLKPHNVVIGAYGEVVVIDWGLAKDLGQADAAAGESGATSGPGGQTVIGAVVGTPAYMPPEQARGEPVDERADVYSLGALLYHLLTGAPPFTGTSSAEVLDQVLSGAPPPVDARQAGVPRDLAAVIAKAMERDPRARYATAGELCEELRRFVTGQLVRAHQYPRAVLVRRAMRRHPVITAIGVFAVVLVLLGAVALRRILIEKAAAESRERQLLLGHARASLETDPTASVALLKRYPDRPGESEAVRAIALDAESRGVARHVFSPHTIDVRDVAFAPDGARLASAGADGTLYLWDTSTGGRQLLYTANAAITNVVFDPRGTYLAASLGPQTGILLWDRGRQTSRVLPMEDDVYAIEFSPDGSLLAGGSIGGKIVLWSMPGGEARRFSGHEGWISHVLFSPDGRSLLSVSEDRTARLWTVATGDARVLDLEAEGYAGAFSPDGARVAVGCQDGSVRLYAAADPALPARVFHPDGGAVDYVAFSPDGARLAWAGFGRAVYVADLRSYEVEALHGHEDDVTGMAFLPDGTLLTASADATIRRWDLASGLGAVLRGHTDHVHGMAVSRDGRRLASAGADRQVRLWQLEPAPRSYAVHGSKEGEFRSPRGHDILYFEQDGGTVGVLDLRTGAIQLARTARPRARLAGDPTGTRLAYRDLERHVSFIELQGSVERRLPLTVEMVGAAIEFSPDGKTLAFPGWKGIYLVDVASLAARELPYPSGPIRDQTQLKVRRLQFSDDGRRIMSVGVDIALWDLASGRAIAIPRRQPGPPSYVVGSRDLAVIAEGGAAGGLWLLDRAKGSWRRLLSTEREVFPIAFSPDGTRVAAGTDQGQLRVWRVSDGARVEELVGHAGPIRRMEFADDGRRLVSAGVDGAVRLWDLGTGQELRAIRAHSGREVEWVGFRGTDIVSAGRDGMARIWPPVARSPGPVARLLDGLTSFRMDPGDN